MTDSAALAALAANNAFEVIPCPVCNGSDFVPLFAIAPRQFLNPKRLDTYDLARIHCTLDTQLFYQRCRQCGYTGANPRLRSEFSDAVYNEVKSDLGDLNQWAFEDTDLGALYRTYHKWYAVNLFELALSFFQDRFTRTHNEGFSQIRLLDVGCGYGHILELARVFGLAANGVEIDSSRIAHCNSLGLDVFRPEELPAGQFDIILSTSVIEHTFDLNGYLELVSSRLAQGGIFAVTGLTPEIITIEKRRGKFKNVAPIEHLNLLPRPALYRLATRHGLKPVPLSRFLQAMRAGAHISPRFIKYLVQRYIRFDFWRGSFLEIMVRQDGR